MALPIQSASPRGYKRSLFFDDTKTLLAMRQTPQLGCLTLQIIPIPYSPFPSYKVPYVLRPQGKTRKLWCPRTQATADNEAQEK